MHPEEPPAKKVELSKMGDSAGKEELVTKELRQIKINVGVICVVWVFTFTSYSGLQNLESSLNPDVGTYALAALTGGGTLTCLLAPTFIHRLGCKGCLTISWLCLCVFIGGNYYPKAYVLIPAAFIEGLATGLMWTAQGVYVTTCAARYATLTGESMETVISKMFGIFCMAFQSTQVWGNLISSTVLQQSSGDDDNNNSSNSGSPPETCGAHNCPTSGPGNNSTGSGSGAESTLEIILISVYMAFAVIGLLVTVIFLRQVQPRAVAEPPSTKQLLVSTLHLTVSNSNMMLLVPLSLYIGLEQSIMFSEFTKAYVTCELGIEWVGYTMLSFGVSDTVFSPLAGVLGKYLKRPTMFLGATLLNLATLSVLLLWRPLASEKFVFFLIPAVWGLADAVWQTQSAALIGSAFYDNQEPAFANLRMFQALGMTVAYLYSASLCEYVKLYIAGALLVLTVALTTVVELRIKKNAQNRYGKMVEE